MIIEYMYTSQLKGLDIDPIIANEKI
jgi:hypothetical protein